MKKYLALTAVLFPMASFAQDITIEDVYAFAPNAESPAGAVFMKITNAGDQAVTLKNAQTDIAKKIEVHDNIMEGDVMKMVHQEDGIEIPANGCLILERGGYHVMLMGLNEPLVAGKEFDMKLEFDGADAQDIHVAVDLEYEAKEDDGNCKRSEAAMMHGGQMMNHGSDHN